MENRMSVEEQRVFEAAKVFLLTCIAAPFIYINTAVSMAALGITAGGSIGVPVGDLLEKVIPKQSQN